MMRLKLGLFVLPLFLAACRFIGAGASPAITVDYFFLGETYTQAGLVISACRPRAQSPPGSLQVRANLLPAGEWPAREGATAAAPADYIAAPNVIGIDAWGAAMDDASGWRAMRYATPHRLPRRNPAAQGRGPVKTGLAIAAAGGASHEPVPEEEGP
jgi:hypothetical protein